MVGSLENVLPAPVSVRTAPGVWFPLRPGLAVVAPAAAGQVGRQLAALLAPRLGGPPSVRDGAPSPGDVVLQFAGDSDSDSDSDSDGDGDGGPEAYTLD